MKSVKAAIAKKTKSSLPDPTAKAFLSALKAKGSTKSNLNFFRDNDGKTKSTGTAFGNIFALAKKFSSLPLDEVETLLESEYYEARLGAVSIMDFQARNNKTPPEHRQELYDLYIRRHDRINNWDLVDRSAPFVVGGYLFDKPRLPLYKLAKSKNPWERRTAIVSTWYFIRKNDIGDTFKLAEILVNDPHDLVQKAVGSWVREAGKRDKKKLLAFLDQHAATMPRTTLRYAVEKLEKKLKDRYLKVKS